MGDEAGSRDPSVIWVWAMTKSKLFLEWEVFQGWRREENKRIEFLMESRGVPQRGDPESRKS